jgi:hypothetical protein
MNSNRLPANWDLALALGLASVLGMDLGMEALEAPVLGPEGALVLAGAMEAN